MTNYRQNSEEYKDTENNLQAAQARLEFEKTGFKAQLHTIDVLKLEELPPPTDNPSATDRTRTTRAPRGQGPKAEKVKPEVKGLDPERWIKKSEREGYRASRRGQGVTQGTRVR
jgi:hypothetical protein